MKVTPWNRCPLEDEQRRGFESEGQLAPAPGSKGLDRGGCASFSCFGCAAAELNRPSFRKAGPTKNQEILHEAPSSCDGENQDRKRSVNPVDDNVVEGDEEKTVRVGNNSKGSINGAPDDSCPDGFTDDAIEKSVGGNRESPGLNQSLNRSESEYSALDDENGECCSNITTKGILFEKDGNDSACQVQRRKVQWKDAIGGELYEIREFEMSDDSDDEFGLGNGKCMCVIM